MTDRQLHIHVSGHPGRPELAQMYKWIRPEIVVPVHGEARHMAEQARFALACGVPKSIYQKNGDIIRLAPKGPKKVGSERTGRLVLDGDVILPADGSTIGERRKVSINGIIAVALPLDPAGRLAGKPLLYPLGVPVEVDREDFLADATNAAELAFGDSMNSDKVREAVRLAVRRCATLWTGKKPVVEVMAVSADQ